MASFDIDPVFAAKLDWVRDLVAEEIEPLDHVNLAYLNEILGRSAFAPSVFGCQAPDKPTAGAWPTEHLPTRRAAAFARAGETVEG